MCEYDHDKEFTRAKYLEACGNYETLVGDKCLLWYEMYRRVQFS
jgi:hypothetical protein